MAMDDLRHGFDQLCEHAGHEVACVTYGTDDGLVYNVALECETCGSVLIDFDAPEADFDQPPPPPPPTPGLGRPERKPR